MSQIMYRVEVVVTKVNVMNENEEEKLDVVFDALVGETEEGASYTYQDIIAEELFGMTMKEIVEAEGGEGFITPDEALEDQFVAIFG